MNPLQANETRRIQHTRVETTDHAKEEQQRDGNVSSLDVEFGFWALESKEWKRTQILQKNILSLLGGTTPLVV
ncbi:hypothetical protein EYF80_045215 [Liparis tanakae]|uniref:Uncharacterized protein n=1 Tax=Liparis tanakae TaxID=230148 RepID=A0A4Z2FUV2_9TELE|nr:hypothetical protein EYF80_045215 [Liparis tanakae]